MVRGFWTMTAAGLVVAVIALSMRMNFEFGYGLGTSAATAQIFALLSVAFDGLNCTLISNGPPLSAPSWLASRKR